ncbi:hypothetical protein BY996DRAFT_6484274 [Phakopsora pachyrhizi]|nr:hypothetical protein BY996DRAFT_6484274 [Phakopsora pachyrhizi]
MSQFGKKVRVLGISISRWVMLKRVERSGEEDEVNLVRRLRPEVADLRAGLRMSERISMRQVTLQLMVVLTSRFWFCRTSA